MIGWFIRLSRPISGLNNPAPGSNLFVAGLAPPRLVSELIPLNPLSEKCGKWPDIRLVGIQFHIIHFIADKIVV